MAQGAGRPVTVAGGEEAWIVKSAHDAIVGMDAAGVIVYCNPAAARLYDYPLERLVGSRAEMLLPPDRRAEEADVLRRILAGSEVAPYRTDRVRQDGTIVAVSTTISPIADAAGTIIGAATMARRATMQDAHDRFEARVDKQRAEAQDASDRFEVRVDQQREETRDAAARFERRVSAERVQSLDTEDGFQDRMDAQRAQSRSAQDVLRGRLQQGQRLEILDQLAGGVAHDFNNLLGVILNHAEFAADELALGPGADSATAGRDVAQIRRAVERAAGLTHQLLALARREIVQPQVLDLNDVVTDLQELLHHTLGAEIVLETELAEDLRPVLADPGQLEQVLATLAVNARAAMRGGGTVSIRTDNVTGGVGEAGAGPGAHVRMRVGDTGTGMSAEVAERAFEPFLTTRSDGTGPGLGLAAVYGIVAQAGGTITVQTEPGVGTTFTILLPATDAIATPVPEPAVFPRAPRGETVLVVEDDEALRAVTERIFAGAGYRVVAASSGPAALALVTELDGDVDLLVIDVVMPTMLGKEVAEKVRAVRPGIEVLYMSGCAQPAMAAPGRLDPSDHLIEKPFAAAALLDQAGQVLNDHVLEGHAVASGTGTVPAND